MNNLQKILFLNILTLCVFVNLQGQIINGSFEKWDTIWNSNGSIFYLDPSGWKSSNSFLGFGFPDTPVSIDSTAIDGQLAVRIESSASGLDGDYSGFMSQVISAAGISSLNYYMKVDSIWMNGACVFKVYRKSDNTLLFSDSIRTPQPYDYFEIDMTGISMEAADSILVEFEAYGFTGMWEDDPLGYSSCVVDNIRSEHECPDPIWDIGTKWTYELQLDGNTITYATDEIVDTITLDGKLLYVVESAPEGHGIRYFYYEGCKVFNYRADFDLFQLLYDFGPDSDYQTEYRPICDPFFDYDNDTSKTYTIKLDSMEQFEMPDNTVRNLTYYTPYDTTYQFPDTIIFGNYSRSVLDHIGFIQGGLHYTHDWEIGDYICDELCCYIKALRCFENDSVSYNFVGFPCDSTWFLSNIKDSPGKPIIKLYPNPTSDIINIEGAGSDVRYEIYSLTGSLVDSGISENASIELPGSGLYILQLFVNDEVFPFKIYKIP